MTANLMMLLTGLIYLFIGCPIGMAFRFADWSNKQPVEKKSVRAWWQDRLGSNIKSLGLAVVLTGIVVEGSLVQKIPVVGGLGGSFFGLILAAPLGAAITYGSHYLFAAGKRKAEAAAGGPIPEED